MKVGKPQSKRTPVRLRHRIQKASANKQRKQRKEAKKNPQWRSRLKKDPGIPNLFPYKAKLLAEIEESKRKKEEELQKRREIAKAQRQGTAVTAQVAKAASEVAEDDDELLVEPENDDEGVQGNYMEVEDNSNPMAALLASAQARAQAYGKEGKEQDDEDGEEDEDDEWGGLNEVGISAPSQPTKKALPKQALADPVKAVSALVERMQKTRDGIQRMLDHYQIPPLVTAGSDTTSRFLVEVARKRGRLGRGGVPNLHSAALLVLGDLNEEGLKLPAVECEKTTAVTNRGEVQIVSQMAPAFSIEGLFGDKPTVSEAMAVDT